jgi:chromosomal replication initiator protein
MNRPIPLSFIIPTACELCRMPIEDVLGRTRHARVVETRNLAVYAARLMTTASFPEIARALCRPNHSTFVTAHGRILRHIEGDVSYWHPALGERVPAGVVAAWLLERIKDRWLESGGFTVSTLPRAVRPGLSVLKPWEKQGALV